MSAIPREVREQIEALLARVLPRGEGDGAVYALREVIRILDAADREHEDARRAHFEDDDVP